MKFDMKKVLLNPFLLSGLLFLLSMWWGYLFITGKPPVEDLAVSRETINYNLYGINFADADNIWMVGESGSVFHTTDGGKHWRHQNSGVKIALSDVFFVDNTHGWAIGRFGTILYTGNGGEKWEKQDSGVNHYLFDVTFLDHQHGWIVGEFGTILFTEDRGRIWKKINIGEDEHGFGMDVALYKICFSDHQHGWIVGEFGTILHTEDGGKTWVAQESETENTLFAVDFSDSNLLRAAGTGGIILKTSDGGKKWEKEDNKLGLKDTFLDIFFREKGWTYPIYLVGQGAFLNRYEDWLNAPSQAFVADYYCLTKVAFASPSFGYAIGQNGLILKFDENRWGEVWHLDEEYVLEK